MIAELVELLIAAAALDVLANRWASGELLESDPTAHLTAAMWIVGSYFPDPANDTEALRTAWAGAMADEAWR